MAKRIHPVKLLLDDEELAAAQRKALALDLPVSEVIRRCFVQSMWGSLGLAERRAKRTRGSEEFLLPEDFDSTGFGCDL